MSTPLGLVPTLKLPKERQCALWYLTVLTCAGQQADLSFCCPHSTAILRLCPRYTPSYGFFHVPSHALLVPGRSVPVQLSQSCGWVLWGWEEATWWKHRRKKMTADTGKGEAVKKANLTFSQWCWWGWHLTQSHKSIPAPQNSCSIAEHLYWIYLKINLQHHCCDSLQGRGWQGGFLSPQELPHSHITQLAVLPDLWAHIKTVNCTVPQV